MNFDNLKSNYQSLSYSGGDTNNVDFIKKIEGLVERVRMEDQKDKQRLLGVSIIAAGCGLAFGLTGLIKYLENSEGTEFWGFLLYALAIICFAPLLINAYHFNRSVNYDVSLIQFIESLEKRFALFQIKDLWLIPGILVLGISVAFMVSGSGFPTIQTFLLAQVVFVFISTIGFLSRLILWRRKLLLRDELRRIKEGLM